MGSTIAEAANTSMGTIEFDALDDDTEENAPPGLAKASRKKSTQAAKGPSSGSVLADIALAWDPWAKRISTAGLGMIIVAVVMLAGGKGVDKQGTNLLTGMFDSLLGPDRVLATDLDNTDALQGEVVLTGLNGHVDNAVVQHKDDGTIARAWLAVTGDDPNRVDAVLLTTALDAAAEPADSDEATQAGKPAIGNHFAGHAIERANVVQHESANADRLVADLPAEVLPAFADMGYFVQPERIWVLEDSQVQGTPWYESLTTNVGFVFDLWAILGLLLLGIGAALVVRAAMKPQEVPASQLGVLALILFVFTCMFLVSWGNAWTGSGAHDAVNLAVMLGLFLFVGGWLALSYVAFQDSPSEGFMCLLIPGYNIVYAVGQTDISRRLIGWTGGGLGLLAVAFTAWGIAFQSAQAQSPQLDDTSQATPADAVLQLTALPDPEPSETELAQNETPEDDPNETDEPEEPTQIAANTQNDLNPTTTDLVTEPDTQAIPETPQGRRMRTSPGLARQYLDPPVQFAGLSIQAPKDLGLTAGPAPRGASWSAGGISGSLFGLDVIIEPRRGASAEQDNPVFFRTFDEQYYYANRRWNPVMGHEVEDVIIGGRAFTQVLAPITSEFSRTQACLYTRFEDDRVIILSIRFDPSTPLQRTVLNAAVGSLEFTD